MPRKRNSTKVNLVISVIFHSVIVLALFFFAAKQGMLGKKMKTLTAELVQKEKPPEKPKEKPPEPKPDQPKVDKPVEMAKAAPVAPPPVAANVPPPAAQIAAPAAVISSDFDFADGAKGTQTIATDPISNYKAQVEFQIKQKWLRPDNIADQDYVAEIEVAIDNKGKVIGNDWKRGSGDKKWDDSVHRALSQTQAISLPPPKGFPTKFLVRFDVQIENEPILSASLK
jgi:type IV secretory pathway VirB10-like protein